MIKFSTRPSPFSPFSSEYLKKRSSYCVCGDESSRNRRDREVMMMVVVFVMVMSEPEERE